MIAPTSVMADFTQVRTALWQNPVFEQLDAPAKLLWFNLLTTPSRNTAGLYIPSPTRMAFETWLSPTEVTRAITSLVAIGWVEYDEAAGMVRIVNFVREQPQSETIVRKWSCPASVDG